MELNQYLERMTEKSVYLRGVKLNLQKKVHNLNIKNYEESNNEIIEIKSKVESSGYEDDYRIKIIIVNNKIVTYSCECMYFINHDSSIFCKHIVATCLNYFNNRNSKSIKTSTLTSLKKQKSFEELLIANYKQSKFDINQEKYNINVFIHFIYNKIAVSLEIYNHKNKRKYKVRKLERFIWLYLTKSNYEFSQIFSIDFERETIIFDSEYNEIWKLLINNFKMEREISEYNSSFFDDEYGFISSNQFILLLNNFKGKEIEFYIHRWNDFSNKQGLLRKYYISEKNYNFDFEFNYINSKLMFKAKTYPEFMIKDEPILVENNIVYLISQEEFESYKPLFELLDKTKNYSFNLDDLENIVQYLLPNLKTLKQDLVLPEVIEKNIISKELEPIFYLDYIDNQIILSISFKYGQYILNNQNNFEPKLEENHVLVRNFEQENRIKYFLLSINFFETKKIYYLENDEDKYIEFLTENVYELNKYGQVYYSSEFKKINFIKNPEIDINIEKSDNNFLDFSFSIKGVSNQELLELFFKSNMQKKFCKLTSGTVLSLENLKLDHFSSLLESLDFNLSKNNKTTFKLSNTNAMFLANHLEDKYNLEWKEKEKYLNAFNKLSNLLVDYQFPKTLNAVLRKYQEFGFKWLKTLSQAKLGGILADEMGLGKTLQAITFILSEFENNNKLKSVLIVCPSSLIYNWESEIKKFAPNIKILIIIGSPSQRKLLISEILQYQIVIISYPLLRVEIDKLKDIEFSYSFIDEAQYIKNFNSLISKSVKKINASVRFALTGTPIENSLLELWSIFDYCLPGYLLSKSKFESVFLKPIYNEHDNEKLRILKNKIKPFVLRRLKKEVIKELPDKIVHNILVEMTEGQKKLYAAYAKTAKKELKESCEKVGVQKSKIKILAALTRLRQICCDPSVFISNYTDGSGKFEVLKDIVEENIKDNKLLIFSQFTEILKNINNHLNFVKENILYLDGQVKSLQRKELVDNFMTKEQFKIFLISLKAGEVGLNLTKANIVVHFDPWWNPAVENQATDRAHRIGQKKTVEVIKLIVKGTIEEKIIKLHERKLKLSQDVIDDNDNLEKLLTNLSQSEISELLEVNF